MKAILASTLCVAVLVSIYFAVRFSYAGSSTPQLKPDSLFKESVGVMAHPGDPTNAERDLRRLYLAIVAFRKETGRLPTPAELLDTTKPIADGIQVTVDDLNNPDEPYGEVGDSSRGTRRTFDYVVSYVSPRPNGIAKPAFPKDKERDVWLTCELYTRRSQTTEGKEVTKYHFSGVIVALFSDGKIERIPESKLLTVRLPSGVYPHILPGQAGTPKDAFPMTQFWKAHYGANVTWD